MTDAEGRTIYVGKARSLRARVRSYFNGEKDIKTRFLLANMADIEVIITATEYEALILENNLIKQRKPRYNINLKDGKTYPVIRITAEEFPRVYRTRRMIFDGSEYFGPFPKPQAIDLYLRLIERHFPLCKHRGSQKKRSLSLPELPHGKVRRGMLRKDHPRGVHEDRRGGAQAPVGKERRAPGRSAGEDARGRGAAGLRARGAPCATRSRPSRRCPSSSA